MKHKKITWQFGGVAIACMVSMALGGCETVRKSGMEPPPPPPPPPPPTIVTTDAHIWVDAGGCACAVKSSAQGATPCVVPTDSDDITIDLPDAGDPTIINEIQWESANSMPFQIFFDPLENAQQRRTQTGTLKLKVNSKTPAKQALVNQVEYKYTVVMTDGQWNPIAGCSALDPKIIVQP